MADISKIRIESGLYDIKDTTARNSIDTINNETIPNLQETLQAGIDEINNDTIPDLQETLQAGIDEINNDTIPALETELQSISNKDQTIENIVVISDSYGVMDGVTNYPNYIKQYLNLDNDHFYNNSYGGTGFAHVHDDKTFTTLVQECMALSEERRNAVTHVLLAGGYNDQWSTDADIIAGVQACVSTAHNVFPNAKIYVAHIGWSTNSSDLQHTFRNYYEGTCLTKYGKFIINSQNILRADLISNDNIHPNAEGSQILAKNLINGLQIGSCFPISGYVYLKDSNDNNMGVIYQDNNVFSFELYDTEFGYNGTANGTQINYKTLASNSMISGHNCRFSVPCMFVNSGNGEYVMGTCLFIIDERSVKLSPTGINPAGNNYMSFTSIRFSNTVVHILHASS